MLQPRTGLSKLRSQERVADKKADKKAAQKPSAAAPPTEKPEPVAAADKVKVCDACNFDEMISMYGFQ